MAEMVMPLSRFVPQLRNKPDEVYVKALARAHGQEKHTPTQWLGLLEQLKSQPVSYDRLRSRPGM